LIELAAKYTVKVSAVDLKDRVKELAIRYAKFAPLATPAGQILNNALEARHNGNISSTSTIALVESFLDPLCKCAVDEVVYAPKARAVPTLYKVAAKAVAEVASQSILDLLKTNPLGELSPVILSNVVHVTATDATKKVLDLLNTSTQAIEPNVRKFSLGSVFSGALSAFAPIAVSAATIGMQLLTRSPSDLSVETEQLIANNVTVTSPRFLEFLPYIGIVFSGPFPL
jgi:hypothetical protein